MGARSNVILQQEDGQNLWLYSHWGGETFQTSDLARALRIARGRVGDPAYFNRIVITEIFIDLQGSETGGGVSLAMDDNDGYDYFVVDVMTGTIRRHPVATGITGPHTTSWTLSEFIAKFGTD